MPAVPSHVVHSRSRDSASVRPHRSTRRNILNIRAASPTNRNILNIRAEPSACLKSLNIRPPLTRLHFLNIHTPA